MKKSITTFCLIVSATIILDSMGVWHMLMMFLFVGIIPGTDIILAPSLMMSLMSILIGLVIGSFVIMPIMRKYSLPNIKQATLKTRRLSRV